MHKPKKILNITITYPNKDVLADFGEFSDGILNQSIAIREDLSEEETKFILAHELLHYAFFKSGTDQILYELGNKTNALEEGVVGAIMQQLIATEVLVVNPKYFKKGKK